MSHLPQNSEAFDNNPEYAKPHRGSDSVQSGTDGQPLPASEFSPSVWKMGAGEKAAHLSLIFGVFGMLTLALAFWWVSHGFGIGMPIIIAAPLLNLLGLWQAFVARRYGKRAIGGLLLNGLGLCIFIGIVALIIMILSALSGLNDSGPSRTLNALMQYWN